MKIKVKETGEVIDAPQYTGFLMFEMGIGDLYSDNPEEKASIDRLLQVRKEKFPIEPKWPKIPDDNVWDDIADQKDPNSPTKKKLRIRIKELIENVAWNKPYFTNNEIFKASQNSNDEFLKEHLQSVPPRIRELYKLGFLKRVIKDGKEVNGHYIIVKENWRKQMEDVIYD